MKKIVFSSLVLSLLFLPSCLVSNDDYEQAKKERDEFKIKYEQLQEKNDALNKEINYLYSNIENLNKEYVLAEAFEIYKITTENILLIPATSAKTKIKDKK